MKAIPKPFNEIDWSIGGRATLLGGRVAVVVYRSQWLYDYSDNTYF
ncbi:hypothetical protein [Shewanella sediminis]|nr:hypothetical protein [Shewanella sediminis]